MGRSRSPSPTTSHSDPVVDTATNRFQKGKTLTATDLDGTVTDATAARGSPSTDLPRRRISDDSKSGTPAGDSGQSTDTKLKRGSSGLSAPNSTHNEKDAQIREAITPLESQHTPVANLWGEPASEFETNATHPESESGGRLPLQPRGILDMVPEKRHIVKIVEARQTTPRSRNPTRTTVALTIDA